MKRLAFLIYSIALAPLVDDTRPDTQVTSNLADGPLPALNRLQDFSLELVTVSSPFARVGLLPEHSLLDNILVHYFRARPLQCWQT